MAKRPAVESDLESDGDQAAKRARTQDNGADERRQAKGKGKANVDDDDDFLEDVISGDVFDLGDDFEIPDEQFEEENTDRIRAQIQKGKQTNKRISDYGVIQRVEMFDFMCHRNLQFEFHPRINFIIGHNGSGKSAVLSAITIVLGGKTGSTGRGTGLKSFIREGQHASEITIQIKNEGPDAFKHELYGDSIVITRRFTKEGSTSWKMRSADLKTTVSTRREELSAICDHMNIQVDNPLNVLTQDGARQFLSASTPHDKYKFFLIGTQLFQLSQDYETCLSNITKTIEILSNKREAIPDLSQRHAEALKKLEEATKAREQKQKAENLRKELAWSYVDGKQVELEANAVAVAKAKKYIPRAERGVADAEAEFTESGLRIEELEKELAALGQPDELATRRETLKAEITESKAKLRKVTKDLRDLAGEKAIHESTIAQVQQQIEAEQARMAAHSQQRRDDLFIKIQEAQEEVATAEARVKSIEQQIRDLQDQMKAAKDEGGALAIEQNNLRAEIVECDNIIETAQQATSNQYAPYGNNLKYVCEEIQKKRWHGQPPVGPLGLYVKVRDAATWGDLLRSQLGGMLMAFAITDSRDRAQLKQLLVQTKNFNNMIVINENDHFDYSHGEPPAEYMTVLRALEFSDEYVLRVLINQQKIESLVLGMSRRDLQDKLQQLRGGNGWSREGFNVRVFPEGGNSNAPLNTRRTHHLFLTGGVGANDVSRQEERKRELERTGRNLGGRIEELKRTYSNCRDEVEKLKRSAERAAQVVSTAKANVMTLQAEANEDLPTSIAGFEEAKEEEEQKLAHVLTQYAEVTKRKAIIDSANHELQTQISAINEQLNAFNAEAEGVRARITDESVDRVQKQNNVKHYEERLRVGQKALADAEKAYNISEKEFENWTEKAKQFCDEWRNPRKTEAVEKELKSVDAAIQQQKKKSGLNIDEVSEEVKKTHAALQKAKEEYHSAANLTKALKVSLKMRMLRWNEFRRHIALRTKLIFQYHLSQRGYYGKIMFDHVAGTLNIKVQTDDQNAEEGAAEKDPRSLSGGEKSFSTICLLLSLWDSIGCPLRCLDEFDVFMDAVNRRISMKMMIETANASPDKQYILITPQDMTNIHIGDTIKVHRMQDPERNTGRLRFGAAPSNE